MLADEIIHLYQPQKIIRQHLIVLRINRSTLVYLVGIVRDQ